MDINDTLQNWIDLLEGNGCPTLAQKLRPTRSFDPQQQSSGLHHSYFQNAYELALQKLVSYNLKDAPIEQIARTVDSTLRGLSIPQFERNVLAELLKEGSL